MSVNLSPQLALSETWQQIKKYCEKGMTDSGLSDYTVNILIATPEYKDVVPSDEMVYAEYHPEDQSMEFVVHPDALDSASVHMCGGPKDFADIQIVDTLSGLLIQRGLL